MSEFPSQSHKANEPREVVPVTRSVGRVRKAPMGRRLRETFIQGDAKTVWSSMLWNSFFPGMRDQLAEAVHQGIDSLFNGGTTSYRPNNRRSPAGSNISRHNPDRALGARQNERITREDRGRQDTSVIEIDSRAEAEEVLAALSQTIDQFDVVTLAEFYQLVRITPDHTDYKFGWEDLGGARISHSRGSYYLDLPPVITLK